MRSLGEKRMEQNKPFAVISGGNVTIMKPASKEFAEKSIATLIDCFELTYLITHGKPLELSEKVYLGHFSWLPATYYDTFKYREYSFYFTQQGNLCSGFVLTENEWLLLIEKAWTDVVLAQSKKEAA